VGNGAGQLQSWLGIARQWALRDQVPTGIRLLPPAQPLVNQVGFTLATQVQYVQQPDPFSGGYVSVSVQQGPSGSVTMVQAYAAPGQQNPPDFYGGYGPNAPQTLWAVQPGDYLEISGQSQVFVVRVLYNPQQNLTCNQLIVMGTPVTNIAPTPDYKIIRQPRPKAGESIQNLPDNVAIDLSTNGQYPWYGNALPVNQNTGTLDILFAPNGSVYNSTGNDMIQLWLRDTSEDPLGQPPPQSPQQPTPGTPYFATFNGEQALVTIYVRTGMIAGNRVDTTLDLPPASQGPQPPWNQTTRYLHPYAYTADGGPSGL
jgi:hypothetical protein